MGRDPHEKRHRERLPPFVPLLVGTLDSPAWRAMSHGAQMLFVALKRRYSIKLHNNGRIFLSQRLAAKELGSHHNQIARWFRELQYYRFIVMTTPGCLGVEGKGKAPHWRLTELGYMRELPTRDFMQWDGTPFADNRKTKSRAGKPAHTGATKSRAGKQARGVQENQHTSVPENRPPSEESVPENQHILNQQGVPENRHITSLPLSGPPIAPADDLTIPDFLRR
jgi:hypothetical protein